MFLKRTKPLLFLIFVILLVFNGCHQRKTGLNLTPKVIVAKVEQRDVQLYKEYTGVTTASIEVSITARVKGFLEKMLFVPGDIVKEGDKLFIIEQTQYKATVNAAQANLEKAKSSVIYNEAVYKRDQELVAAKTISQEEFEQSRDNFEQAKANVQLMQANLDVAKLNYSYTEVISPVTGKISRNLVDPGNLVGGSDQQETKLATVTKMDPIYVYFQISDSDFGEMLRGKQALQSGSTELAETHADRGDFEISLIQKTEETGKPLPDQWQYKGKVTYEDNTIDQATGSITLRGEIANPNDDIYPGWICHVRVPYHLEKEALLVYEEAVGIDLDSRYMMIVGENQVVERRTVNVGELIEGNMLVIKSGLKPGETYVLEGLQKAKNNKPVRTETTNLKPEN